MRAIKVVFKDGVFVPLEEVRIDEGAEAIVVYADGDHGEKPDWWNCLPVDENRKEALKLLSEKLAVLPLIDVKVSVDDGDFEVFVLVHDEMESVRSVMEAGMKVYEETGVYVPIQVISKRRLNRWKEQGSEIYRVIEGGVSIK